MDALPLGRLVDVGDGLQLHAHVIGEGQPILFLHGSGPGASGWSNFRSNAEFLAPHGYACVLLDSVGYGHSSKPTEPLYTLDFMAGLALKAMDGLGFTEQFVALGNSQGGAQAIWLALHHPARIKSLVLMAPGGLEDRDTYMAMRGIRSMMRCLYGPEGLTLGGMQQVFAKQVFDTACMPEDVVEQRFEIGKAQPIEAFKNMRVANQEDRLGEIGCPTLGLWGMNDLFCPPSGATKLATGIPDCRVILLNRCGHWVMVEHADTFNRAVLDFLTHG